jgi:hypothetical protein
MVMGASLVAGSAAWAAGAIRPVLVAAAAAIKRKALRELRIARLGEKAKPFKHTRKLAPWLAGRCQMLHCLWLAIGVVT